MTHGRKRSGPPTDSSSSPSFPKEGAVCLVPGTRYTSTQVLLCTCFVFQGTTFFAASYSSRTESHGQSSGKVFIAAKLFRGLLECLRGSSRSSITCYAQLSKRTNAKKYLLLHTWYLIYEYQVLLLCTCFLFQGSTFCGQLLVRELS